MTDHPRPTPAPPGPGQSRLGQSRLGFLRLSRAGLGAALLLGLPVALSACGQEVTGTSSSSARDLLYFNDSASGLPAMYSGERYSGSIAVAGGAGPYTLRVVSGSLPPGITLSGQSLSGVPTATGTYKFTLEVTDSTLNTRSKEYTVNVNTLPPLALVIGLPSGELRGETRLPVTVTAPRNVRAARLSWELPQNVTVTRVQSAEAGGLLFWKQDGPNLTIDLGFKTVPRSGARVALISLKPGKPTTLNVSRLGYEARDGEGKLLVEQKLPEAPKPAASTPATTTPTTAPSTEPNSAPADSAERPAPEAPVPTVETEDTNTSGTTTEGTPPADPTPPAPTPEPVPPTSPAPPAPPEKP